jgi:hypothetical protein
VSALALSVTLKKMMAETQEVLAKRNEKRHWEKEVTDTTFIELTKQAIEVQRMDRGRRQVACIGEPDHVRKLEHHGSEQIAWFDKKLSIIRQM